MKCSVAIIALALFVLAGTGVAGMCLFVAATQDWYEDHGDQVHE